MHHLFQVHSSDEQILRFFEFSNVIHMTTFRRSEPEMCANRLETTMAEVPITTSSGER